MMIIRKTGLRILLTFLVGFSLSTENISAQYNKYYFYYVGRNMLMESRYRDAIETLNILLRADPNAAEAYFLRGVAKFNLDDLLGADYDFTTAIEKNPVYTLAYHYRAITRSRLGDYDDALKDFREAIDLRPDLPGPYYSRGVTYLLSRQFDKAIEDFNEFLKFEPKVADAHIHKGTSYAYLKDTTRAFEAYNDAIRINRENPEVYNRRGVLYLNRHQYDEALDDFNTAIRYDSTAVYSYFNRAILYANTKKPMDAIGDLERVIRLDSTLSVAYFNRAILYSQIGAYNQALEDYNRVTELTPNNVLVYYNRANLYSLLGYPAAAIEDYTRAIDLYPDFANAYLNRSRLRYSLMDVRGSQEDQKIAETKIAEYQSKLTDSTFSIYADTSRNFNRLISFDPDFGDEEIRPITGTGQTGLDILPLFRYAVRTVKDTLDRPVSSLFRNEEIDTFTAALSDFTIRLVTSPGTGAPDSLMIYDQLAGERIHLEPNSWIAWFIKGITQSQIRQYTSAITSFSRAIELDPGNAFLYLNRSAIRTEMIDFISSIDNSYHKIALESDPANRLRSSGTRIYNYDEALYDLNKAQKLAPDIPYIYYNRANLLCATGNLPEALEDYTRAIELFPDFAEAHFNRGLVQMYLKDTKKGLLDISKAGELGIEQAYEIVRRYSAP